MTKTSSGKPKSGPPAYANSYAFHHNKSSKLTAHILSLPIRRLCPSCVAVIEWRKKFRKYKPLTVMKKCTVCAQKKIKDAYHVLCGDCVAERSQCGKCMLPKEQWSNKSAEELEAELALTGGEVLPVKFTAPSAVKVEKFEVKVSEMSDTETDSDDESDCEEESEEEEEGSESE